MTGGKFKRIKTEGGGKYALMVFLVFLSISIHILTFSVVVLAYTEIQRLVQFLTFDYVFVRILQNYHKIISTYNVNINHI
mgnify:CR=1 FL=1